MKTLFTPMLLFWFTKRCLVDILILIVLWLTLSIKPNAIEYTKYYLISFVYFVYKANLSSYCKKKRHLTKILRLIVEKQYSTSIHSNWYLYPSVVAIFQRPKQALTNKWTVRCNLNLANYKLNLIFKFFNVLYTSILPWGLFDFEWLYIFIQEELKYTSTGTKMMLHFSYAQHYLHRYTYQSGLFKIKFFFILLFLNCCCACKWYADECMYSVLKRWW